MTKKKTSISKLKELAKSKKYINLVELGRLVDEVRKEYPELTYELMPKEVGLPKDRLNVSHLALELPPEVIKDIEQGCYRDRVVRKMTTLRHLPDYVIIRYANIVRNGSLKVDQANKLADELLELHTRLSQTHTDNEMYVLYDEVLTLEEIDVEHLKEERLKVEEGNKKALEKVTVEIQERKSKRPSAPNKVQVGDACTEYFEKIGEANYTKLARLCTVSPTYIRESTLLANFDETIRERLINGVFDTGQGVALTRLNYLCKVTKTPLDVEVSNYLADYGLDTEETVKYIDSVLEGKTSKTKNTGHKSERDYLGPEELEEYKRNTGFERDLFLLKNSLSLVAGRIDGRDGLFRGLALEAFYLKHPRYSASQLHRDLLVEGVSLSPPDITNSLKLTKLTNKVAQMMMTPDKLPYKTGVELARLCADPKVVYTEDEINEIAEKVIHYGVSGKSTRILVNHLLTPDLSIKNLPDKHRVYAEKMLENWLFANNKFGSYLRIEFSVENDIMNHTIFYDTECAEDVRQVTKIQCGDNLPLTYKREV